MNYPSKHWKKRPLVPLLVSLLLLGLATTPMWWPEPQQQEDRTTDQETLPGPGVASPAMAPWPQAIMRGFTGNRGQVQDPDIAFVSGTGSSSFMFGTSAYFIGMTDSMGQGSVVKVSYPGSAQVVPRALNPLPHRTNLFLGSDASQWVQNLPGYGTLVYDELYPGVDLIFYLTEKGLKYDFLITPGADPGVISCCYEGSSALWLDPEGDLHVTTPGRELVEEAPEAYQLKDKEKAQVHSYFTLAENTFGFGLGDYDPNYQLIIDPLIYSSFIGGTDGEVFQDMALDRQGNIITLASTSSLDYPVSSGAFNESAQGRVDTVVSKLSANGSSLLYSSYLGGSSRDDGLAITLDDLGNAVITGVTNSTNFPTTEGCFDSVLNGTFDAFLCKLSANGSQLLYSTLLGGEDDEEGWGVALDTAGQPLVTGRTFSEDFPTTNGSYDESFNGKADVFVSKFNHNVSKLLFSSYVGGSDHEMGYQLILDDEDNCYVTGSTLSQDFPSTDGAFEQEHNDKPENPWGDAFVFKLAANGSTLAWSTYLGDEGQDIAQSMAMDETGNLYVTGFTNSSNFPTTEDCYSDSGGGSSEDIFVCKLSPDGSGLVYSSYIPGEGRDRGYDIALDKNGNAYVTGETNSSNFPSTKHPPSLGSRGGYDSFVLGLSQDGQRLLFSTTVGGKFNDLGRGIALDQKRNIFLGGTTISFDFPVTEGSYGDSFNGPEGEIFVLKLNLTQPQAIIDSHFPLPVLNDSSVNFAGHGVDNGSIMRYVWHSSLDGELHNSTTANFSGTGLSPGEHEISFWVLDDQGYWSSDDRTALTIYMRPVAEIRSISPEPAKLNETVRFRANSTDDGSIDRYSWASSLDGEFYNGSDSVCYNYRLSRGQHSIYLQIRDNHGLWSKLVTGELTVAGRPEISIARISPSPASQGEVINFQGLVTGEAGILCHVWVSSRDGEFYNGSLEEFSFDGLSVGEHKISYRVMDELLVWSENTTTTLTVTEAALVNQPPELSISSPANNTTLLNSLKVTGSASDPDGSVTLVQYRLNNGEWQTAAGTGSWVFTIDTDQLQEGWHSISVRGFDGEDHSDIKTITLLKEPQEQPELAPDFQVLEEDVSFSHPPQQGRNTSICVLIHNIGNLSGSVVVDITINTSQGGTPVLEQTIQLDPERSATLLFNWTTQHKGEAEIVITLQNLSQASEKSLDNNQLTLTVTVLEGEENDEEQGFLDDLEPATTVVNVSFLSVLGLGVAFLTVERFKYKAILTLFPLYTRLSKNDIEKDIEEQNLRGRIYQHIIENPGTHFSLVLKSVKGGNGSTCYHLDVLERTGFIKSRRKGRKTFYFDKDAAFPYKLQSKLSSTAMAILDFLNKGRTVTVSEIAEVIGKSVTTTSETVRELERKGFVSCQRKHKFKMCTLTEKGESYLNKHRENKDGGSL